MTGHKNLVLAVAITPDGKTAVSSSSDKTLKLWNLETGKEISSTLTSHKKISSDLGGDEWVRALAITPDGKQAVSASNNIMKLWNLEAAKGIEEIKKNPFKYTTYIFRQRFSLLEIKEISTLTGHIGWIEALAITPDGKKVVSASNDKTLKVWDLETGKEISTLTGHIESVTAVAIAPNGKTAISGSVDATLKMWNLETGKEILTLLGHNSVVDAVAIASDGKKAVSGSYDETLKLWDLETGKEISTFTGESHINCCAISPDGLTVVAGETSGRIHFLRLEVQ